MDYTLPEFLAHAITLEREAAERYLELADMMESHRNDEVSALFRDMVRYSRLHHDSIVERAGGIVLPTIGPWDYFWRTPPEAGGDEAFDYTLNAYDALRYARENELRRSSTTPAQASRPPTPRSAPGRRIRGRGDRARRGHRRTGSRTQRASSRSLGGRSAPRALTIMARCSLTHAADVFAAPGLRGCGGDLRCRARRTRGSRCFRRSGRHHA